MAGERGLVSVAVLEQEGRWVLVRIADGSAGDAGFDPDSAATEQGCREVALSGSR